MAFSLWKFIFEYFLRADEHFEIKGKYISIIPYELYSKNRHHMLLPTVTLLDAWKLYIYHFSSILNLKSLVMKPSFSFVILLFNFSAGLTAHTRVRESSTDILWWRKVRCHFMAKTRAFLNFFMMRQLEKSIKRTWSFFQHSIFPKINSSNS